MATKCKVLQTMAGMDYGTAEPGDEMVWPDLQAEELAEKGMVKIIGHERGGNMMKPYIIGRPGPSKAIFTKITGFNQ